MIEPVRILADWLEDATHGVNAKLATVPRDVGDAQPPAVTVYDETRDDRIARGRVADPEDTLPAVYVTLRNAALLPESQVMDDGFFNADLLIRYVTRQSDASRAKQEAFYTLRAAAWSVRRLHRLDGSHASRTRNSVVLTRVLTVSYEPTLEEVEDALLVGTLIVPCEWRDFGTN